MDLCHFASLPSRLLCRCTDSLGLLVLWVALREYARRLNNNSFRQTATVNVLQCMQDAEHHRFAKCEQTVNYLRKTAEARHHMAGPSLPLMLLPVGKLPITRCSELEQWSAFDR